MNKPAGHVKHHVITMLLSIALPCRAIGTKIWRHVRHKDQTELQFQYNIRASTKSLLIKKETNKFLFFLYWIISAFAMVTKVKI